MDYARFNYVAQPEDKIGEKGLFPRINDYDKWAIKWGYQYRPEFKDPAKEKKALRSEVSRTLEGNPRLWWCGDEGHGPDPRSQAEDLGDNQMQANELGLKNLQRVMKDIEKWTAQPDGQYDHLSEIHRAVRAQYQRYANHVQRYLGGKLVNNAPGVKPHDYVSRQQQREALQWLERNVLQAPLWLYPASIVSKLGIDYADEIRNRQQTVLAMLLSGNFIGNLLSAELHADQHYPVSEYLDDVFATVWKPLTDPSEEQNTYRRQQQRTYVDFVGLILNPTTPAQTPISQSPSATTLVQRSDVILYAEQHLDKIEDYLKAQLGSGPNYRHYQNLLLRVKKIREKYESGK